MWLLGETPSQSPVLWAAEQAGRGDRAGAGLEGGGQEKGRKPETRGGQQMGGQETGRQPEMPGGQGGGRAPCTSRVTGGRPPAWGRGPAEDSGSFSGPVPRCLMGLDGHSAEAECSQSWGHTGAMALPGASCISGTGVFSKTVAFSDTGLF